MLLIFLSGCFMWKYVIAMSEYLGCEVAVWRKWRF